MRLLMFSNLQNVNIKIRNYGYLDLSMSKMLEFSPVSAKFIL